MVFSRPLISMSSNPFNNPLMTVPKAPITIGIIVTFMFHSKVHNFSSSLFFVYHYYYYYNIVKWCDGDLKREKSENDFNSKKIIGKDLRIKWVHWFWKNDTIRCQNGKSKKYCLFFGWVEKRNMGIGFLSRKRKREKKLDMYFELF